MILGIDTSTDLLIYTLMSNDKIIAHYQEECQRQQSEQANHVLQDLFDKHDLKPTDISAVVVTKGPGSFTGIRIGMTIAKVITTMFDLPLYSVPSTRYYMGNDYSACFLDARSNKAYYQVSDANSNVELLDLDHIKISETAISNIKGLGVFLNSVDFKTHFIDVKDYWEKEDPEAAKPLYVKKVI